MKIYRKILMSIISIVLLLLTLSASTYAWMHNATQVSLSGFDFQAVGGYGFLISVDDTHFKTSVTTDEIKKAILYAQNPLEYEFDAEGNLVTVVEEGSTSRALSTDEINNKIKEIELRPMTSSNGYTFMGLGNTSLGDNYLSNCIEFSLYFKTTSDVLSDNLSYDIYLNGKDRTTSDGSEVKKTKLSSSYDAVTLTNKLTSIDLSTLSYSDSGSLASFSTKQYVAGDVIKVYSANAMRFSADEETIISDSIYIKVEDGETYVEGDTYYTYDEITNSYVEVTDTLDENSDISNYYKLYTKSSTSHDAQIFEFYNSEDLGSYSTNYTKENVADYDTAIAKLYDATFNASFTYYNNKKSQSPLTELDYETELPKTVRFDIDSDSDTIGEKLTTVKSGQGSKKVTFRFWLEGWDADCFDGIAKSISVSLAFVAKDSN